MPGANAWDLVDKVGGIPISPLLQLRLCDDISNGIAHIHNLFPKARLVHGDIKPENILLTKRLHCKIADFGGSRLAAATTSVKNIVGRIQLSEEEHYTNIYAAPEVLRSPLAALKHTHDIFSFSIVVFEILARIKPNYNCTSKQEYEEAIKTGQRPDLSIIETNEKELQDNDCKGHAKIVTLLKTIMIECWSEEPSDRPEMTEVYKNINGLLSSFRKGDQDKAVEEALSEMDEMFEPSFTDVRETVTIDKVKLPEPNESMLYSIQMRYNKHCLSSLLL